MRYGGERVAVNVLAPLALVVAALPSAAARELSREDVIGLALRQNPQVRASEAVVASAAAQREQARAARWPEVTLDAGTGPSLKAALVPGTAVQSTRSAYHVRLSDLTETFAGDLSVLQPLYTFGKIGLREEAAQQQIAAREAQVVMTQADVAATAAQLYEGHLLARDAGRFFEEALHTLESVIAETQAMLAGGNTTVSQRDVLQLQVASDAAELGLHEANARRRQALAGLRAYLGLPPDEEITVREDQLTPFSADFLSVEKLDQLALAHRPELQALRAGASAYRKLALAEKAGMLPDFFALGLVSGAYTPGRDLVDTRYVVDPFYHFYPALIVGLRWKWQGSMAERRADEARAQAEQLDALYQWAVVGLPAEVVKAHEDAQQAQLDIKTASQGVERAKRWVVLVTADHAIGAADSRDVTDAVTGYTLMRLDYLDAIYRRNTALVQVAKAIGTLVSAGVGPYRGKS